MFSTSEDLLNMDYNQATYVWLGATVEVGFWRCGSLQNHATKECSSFPLQTCPDSAFVVFRRK